MADIKRLESLSKINLTDEEKDYAVEFFDFFESKFNLLESVNTEIIEPLVTVSSLMNVMREDVSHKMISREKLFENAPEENNGHFVVPRILE